MTNFLFFILGATTFSIFSPVIYFVLYNLGGYPEENSDCPKFVFHVGWNVATGVELFAVLLVGISVQSVNSYFVKGAEFAIGLIIFYWTKYLYFSIKGKIIRMNIKLKKAKKCLSTLKDYSFLTTKELYKLDAKYIELENKVAALHIQQLAKTFKEIDCECRNM